MKEFRYYRSGIHLTDIIFNKTNIKHRTKNIENGCWESYKEFNKCDTSYNFELTRIKSILKKGEMIDWEGKDKVRLTEKMVYKRYLKREHKKRGEESKTAWIWTSKGANKPVDLIVLDNEIIGLIIIDRNGCNVLIKPDHEKLSPLSHWDSPDLSEAAYNVRHLGKFRVPMRDNIKLSTEVWLPEELERNQKLPTILVRTPYGRLNYGKKELRFVQRGYALVAQDVRGREESEGEWSPFIYEINDGDDTLNWIANQSWSNGKVGMIGGSYGGYVQWAAAASGNSHLKALVSLVSAGSPFVDVPRKGGTMISGSLAWVFAMSERRVDFDAMVRDDWNQLLQHRPLKDIPAKGLGKEVPFWNQWIEHNDYDEYWEKADWAKCKDKIDVASLIISGWFDDNCMGSSQAWNIVKDKSDNQKLILGPWLHQSNSTRNVNNLLLESNAIRYDLDVWYLRWFDRILKEKEDKSNYEKNVEYYLLGNNQWKHCKEWPPENTQFLNLYFDSNGRANRKKHDGILSFEVPDDSEVDYYLFNPRDPAPHLINLSDNELKIPANYKDIEKRKDVLLYTSGPLENVVSIAGDIYAVFYASSSARDTDWVIRLTDVDEEGNSIRLADGILRARYRNSFQEPELLEPGQIEKYKIKMNYIAYTFKKGHRIRFHITSGAKNLIFPNQNTGNKPGTDTEFKEAYQKIYHNTEYPSHVSLPFLTDEENIVFKREV